MVANQIAESFKEHTTKNDIFALIPLCEDYDQAKILDIETERNPFDWSVKTHYIQSALRCAGVVSDLLELHPSDCQLIGYTFPRSHHSEAALLFAGKEKGFRGVIDALDNRIVRNLPYFGVLVEKNGEINLSACSGEKGCSISQLPLEEMTEEEMRFVSILLRCWRE